MMVTSKGELHGEPPFREVCQRLSPNQTGSKRFKRYPDLKATSKASCGQDVLEAGYASQIPA